MSFLFFLGDFHTEYTGRPTTFIGNTYVETVGSGLYYLNGVLQFNFNANTEADTSFGIKKFYGTTYNPISNYNTRYSLDTISSKFLESGDGAVLAYETRSGRRDQVTYRTMTSPPYFAGISPVDWIWENICPDQQLVYTAMALDKPNTNTYHFTDVYQLYDGNKFTESAASKGRFLPFMTPISTSFFTLKVLQARNYQDFTDRLNIFNTNEEVFLEDNLSLYKPVNETNKTKFYFNYGIVVNKTLDSKKNLDEYNSRKSGFRGAYTVPIFFESYNTLASNSSQYLLRHSVFEVATVNSDDQVTFESQLKAFTTTKNYYPLFNNLYIVGGNSIHRESFFGDNALFNDSMLTVNLSGCYYGFTAIKDNATNTGMISNTFSQALGNGDFLCIEQLCVGKGADYQTDESFSTNEEVLHGFENVFLTTRCHLEYNYQLGGHFQHGNYREFDFTDHDYIINLAAKEISLNYPSNDFNLPFESGGGYYNNYLTTYWSNNLI